MNKTENIQNIDELNSRISVYLAKGYNIIHQDNYGVTLTKKSINWLVLIALIFLLWPGAILYLILYATGNVGKNKSVFLKLTKQDNQNSNTQIPLNQNRKIPIVDKEDKSNTEYINSSFSENLTPLKNYEKQIHELENLYKTKEKIAYELIEKRFSPPQITYDRFISVIDSCNVLFYDQLSSALNIIHIATENAPKVDEELEKRVDTLKSIVKKMDELTNELAINLTISSEQSSDEVKDLLDDMQKLVDSVKEYT